MNFAPLLAGSLLLLIQGALFARTAVTPFTFTRVTDTHIGNGGTNVSADADRVADINALTPRPDFVVNCGDLVDEGTAAQYAVYEKCFAPLTMPRYDVPGNHDVRWAPLGKESIQDALHIPLYRSFEHQGCHFVLLDSTVTLEHWGHFDAAEMAWLEQDLRKTGRETPVFLFFHHWVGRDSVMVDNEVDFMKAIAPYNVKIVFCGHGHADIQWRVNGVQYVMERGLYQGSYDTTEVTPETITLYRHRKEDAEPHRLAVIPTTAQTAAPKPILSVRVEGRAKNLIAARTTGFTPPPNTTWQWKMDTGPWQAMAPSADGMTATAAIHRSQFIPGHHLITVRIVMALPPDRREENHDQGGYGGDARVAALPLVVPAAREPSAGLSEVWSTLVGGEVQSKLILDHGILYVASVSGAAHAIDAATGRNLWTFQTGAPLYGTPCVDGGRLLIGSMDHNVYSLDARTGQMVWKRRLGGPIFAGVRVGSGIACVGAGDSVIYGLDARTGEVRWTYAAKGFIQQQAAFGDDAFYVGAWDNGFYALEAATGALRWRKQFGRSFFYSPSIGAPAVYGSRVLVPSDDDTLHAVEMKTGEVAWEVHSSAGAGSFGYSGPEISADGRIYIGALGDAGSVLCLDAGTGMELWRTDTGSVIYDSSCAEANGVVTIGSVDGSFHALDAASGKLIGSYRLPPGHLLASPALSPDGRTAFIGSLGGRLFALRIRE